MMKLDSCKKKQLYEYSFIKFMLKNIQKPIRWVWQEKYWNIHDRQNEVNYFMNDDIERRNEPYNAKKRKHLNPPLR